MLIRDMTRDMSLDLLKRMHVGHLGCARAGQAYVVPISFAYHREHLYAFASVGRKVEWMRANPLVCVEVEEILSRQEWQTVVILGRYQELPNTPELNAARVLAHDLLARTAAWWEPGYVRTWLHGVERPLEPTYFRISIDELSGHQALSGA